MKKILILLLAGTVTMFTVPTGCIKSGGGTVNPVTAIPDISNFLLQASTAFVAGASALIHISSSSLGNGTFTVNFSLSGSNTGSGSTTLTMNGGSGTFPTPTLSSDGPTTVTIISIKNSAGGTTTVTSNNTSSMFDSTGLMQATYTPRGGTTTTFYATDVHALNSTGSSLLNISGIEWPTNSSSTSIMITLYDNQYSHSAGSSSFNLTTLGGNGSAVYQETGTTLINSPAAHGTITITSVSPVLIGSFNYTLNTSDSSVVTGNFSCPAP